MPITTRAAKGYALTHAEMDANLAAVQALVSGAGMFLSLDALGAVGDGTTDDGPAFTAAYAAASAKALAAATYLNSSVWLVGTPGKKYRIRTSVVVSPKVKLMMPGSLLVGPITGYAPINAGNNPAVPGATDVVGQTAGACFIDTGTAVDSVVDGLEWHHCHFQGFRYAAVSTCLAWNMPIFQNSAFENCNIGFFAYQGAHQPIFMDTGSIGGAAGTTFVGGATCFAAGHPMASKDNYFVDGLVYDSNGRNRDGAQRNTTFDTWFTAAIMRPATVSVTIVQNFVYPFSDALTLSVSGRCIYAPSRNNRGQYTCDIRRMTVQGGDFGALLLANPIFSDFKNIGGEFCFAPGPQPMAYIPLTGVGGLSANFLTINGNSTYPGSAAVAVVAGSGVTAIQSFSASDISGGIIGSQHFTEYLPSLPDGFWGPSTFSDPKYITSAAVGVGSANRTHFYRVQYGGKLTSLALHLNSSSGNIGIAIYRNTGNASANAAPGERIYTSGSIASPGVGPQQIMLPSTIVVRPGDWLAIGADNTTVAFAGWLTSGNPITLSVFWAGVCGYEDVFPPSATPTLTYQLLRGIAMRGLGSV